MGFQYCDIHSCRYEDYGRCPECEDETIALDSALERERAAKELLEIERSRSAEEGICDCCGQRFIERTRVRKADHKTWTGVLSRYTAVGVCPACANRYDAF